MKWLNHYRMKSIMAGVLAAIVLGDGGTVKAEIVIGEPVNAGPVINTNEVEIGCDLSADGLELYFVGHGGGIHVARRETTEHDWLEPERLMFGGSSPAISPDGLELYFHEASDWSLWMLTRPSTDEPWSQPIRVGPPVGDYEAVDPDVSADGLSLYFASRDRPGGYGGFDLWVATRTTRDSEWGEPVHLGPNVNSPNHDWDPAISPDGLTLIFGRGGRLRVTRRKSLDDEWEPSAELEFHNNVNCFSPTFSPDSSSIYFTGPRSSSVGYGERDIWQIKFTPVVDFNGDGTVDASDMFIMLDNWHTDSRLCDITPLPLGDGIVDTKDLLLLSELAFGYIRPLAHWPLNEAVGNVAHDRAGDNHASIWGEAVWRPTQGAFDGALQLDGVDDWASTGPVQGLNEGPVTVIIWIKGGAPNQVLLSQPLTADWLMANPEGKLMSELGGADLLGKPLVSEVIITDGIWHRIAIILDGSKRRLYVDGKVVAEDSQASSGIIASGLNIGVGKDYLPVTFWSGLIDDIRIYNQVVKP